MTFELLSAEVTWPGQIAAKAAVLTYDEISAWLAAQPYPKYEQWGIDRTAARQGMNGWGKDQ